DSLKAGGGHQAGQAAVARAGPENRGRRQDGRGARARPAGGGATGPGVGAVLPRPGTEGKGDEEEAPKGKVKGPHLTAEGLSQLLAPAGRQGGQPPSPSPPPLRGTAGT